VLFEITRCLKITASFYTTLSWQGALRHAGGSAGGRRREGSSCRRSPRQGAGRQQRWPLSCSSGSGFAFCCEPLRLTCSSQTPGSVSCCEPGVAFCAWLAGKRALHELRAITPGITAFKQEFYIV